MRRTLIVFLLAAASMAAGIDGRWTSEITARGKKNDAATTRIVVLSLKGEGGQLTGTVTAPKGKKARALTIHDGQLTGDTFTFTTVHKGKKGEQTWTWRGTVSGDEITGTRSRPGARHGQPFTARRTS